MADQAIGADERKLADLRPAPKVLKDRREIYSFGDLDLKHIDEDIREKVRETLCRHEDIWEGRLWVIEESDNQIETSSDTHPLRQRPY